MAAATQTPGDAQLLGRQPLFEGLSESDLRALAARLRERSLQAGESLFAKGDIGRSMFVVLHGSVRVFLPAVRSSDTPTLLRELGPGDFFGEMALIEGQPRMASVAANIDTRLGELSHDDFVDQLQRSPSAMSALLRVMSQRLRTTTTLLEGRASRNVNLEADEGLTWAQHLADRVAHWNGSWLFIALLFGITAIWVAVNAYAPLRFDEYPYQFFNLFLAILVALQGPLIMMSQNRQANKERLRSEADYLVNLKNEIGIDRTLEQLQQMRVELDAIKHSLAERMPPSAPANSHL